MAQLKSLKPVATAIGAAVIASATSLPVLADNPFDSQWVPAGADIVGAEGSCSGEGGCGGEGSCKSTDDEKKPAP